MSKVQGCELTRIGDLGFEFDGGACGTFKFPEERIMLCFGYAGTRKCVRYCYGPFFLRMQLLPNKLELINECY